MTKRRIDFSHIPMPEALSYLLMLLNSEDVIGTGWNTKTNRIEYVSFDESKPVNEAVAKFIEDKTPVLSFAEMASSYIKNHTEEIEAECQKSQ